MKTVAYLQGCDWNGASDPSGWLASEKHDGHFARWDGQRLLTRYGVNYNAPAWFTATLPPFALDCELFAGYGKRTKLNNAHRWQDSARWRAAKLVVFDVPNAPGDYSARIAEARRTVRAPHAVVVRVWTIRNCESLLADLKRIRARGGEGVMIHRPGIAYTPQRTPDLLKVK